MRGVNCAWEIRTIQLIFKIWKTQCKRWIFNDLFHRFPFVLWASLSSFHLSNWIDVKWHLNHVKLKLIESEIEQRVHPNRIHYLIFVANACHAQRRRPNKGKTKTHAARKIKRQKIKQNFTRFTRSELMQFNWMNRSQWKQARARARVHSMSTIGRNESYSLSSSNAISFVMKYSPIVKSMFNFWLSNSEASQFSDKKTRTKRDRYGVNKNEKKKEQNVIVIDVTLIIIHCEFWLLTVYYAAKSRVPECGR